MVAVKSLWVLWKNFSTNFSFSNLSSVVNNNHHNHETGDSKNKRHVKYNRLRSFEKSTSSHFPIKGSTSTTSFTNNFSLKKSNSSYEPNGNNNNKDKNSSSSSSSKNASNSSPTSIDPSHIGWNYALDNSDTEYDDNDLNDDDDSEEDEDDDEENFNEYRMRMSPDEVSDFDDEDEALTCDVCDRSFPTTKCLADHQFKKRHYGCLQCDSIFPSKEVLEEHRQQMDHYDFVSDYESDTTTFESDEDEDDEEDDDDEFANEEEKERLL